MSTLNLQIQALQSRFEHMEEKMDTLETALEESKLKIDELNAKTLAYVEELNAYK